VNFPQERVRILQSIHVAAEAPDVGHLEFAGHKISASLSSTRPKEEFRQERLVQLSGVGTAALATEASIVAIFRFFSGYRPASTRSWYES
jgi:hypothetical protein